jgi:hypothetical protein
MKNLTTTVARTGFDSERLGSLSRIISGHYGPQLLGRGRTVTLP